MQKLTFVQLNPEDTETCGVFTAMMGDYTRELESHREQNVPQAVIDRWIRSIPGMLGDEDRHLELVYHGKDLVGFLFGKVDHSQHKGYIRPGWGYVMEFYVKPEYRGRGYGRKMYARIEALFRADGVSKLYLTADPVTGKPFWIAMGFKESGDISPENGLEFFEKHLT